MKTAKMPVILVLALALVVCWATVSRAVDMGTAFTYQGRLIDANSAADGLYDFQFKLYSDPCIGPLIAGPVNEPALDVIDGYFTVLLDFGGVFDGDARWLEIGVRDYDPCDVNAFTTLSPRQQVSPTPYAIYAKSDGDWMLSGNDMYSTPSGNVGIGTTMPSYTLHVEKDIGGTTDPLVYLKNDHPSIGNTGAVLKLETNRGGGIPDIGIFEVVNKDGTKFIVRNDGNVGIGTAGPSVPLEVVATTTNTVIKCGRGDQSGQLNIAQDSHNNWGLEAGSFGILVTDANQHIGIRAKKDGYAQLVLRTSGRVGIGPTEPLAKLHVNESADGIYAGRFYHKSTTAGQGIYIKTDCSTTNAALRIDNASGQVFRVESNGRVGIGTTSPQGALDVSSTTGAFIVPRMTTAQRNALTPVNGMIVYDTSDNKFYFRENGAWVTK